MEYTLDLGRMVSALKKADSESPVPKFIETEGHELKDGDYYTPNSYIVDNGVYRCVECGETIKIPNEL